MPATRSATAHLLLALGMLALAALWLSFNSSGSTPVQIGVAILILMIAAYGFRRWRMRGSAGLPVYGLIVLSLWSAYGPSAILGVDANRTLVAGHPISAASYNFTMLLLLVGVISLGMGMIVPPPRILGHFPAIIPTNLVYLRAVLIAGIGAIALQATPEGTASVFRAALIMLLSTIPLVALGILYQAVLQGIGTQMDRALCLVFILASFLRGLGTGWLGPGVLVVLFLGLIYVLERKRIPWLACSIMFVAMAFFQGSKNEYRKLYWNETSSAAAANSSYLSRAAFWVSRSYDAWYRALTSPMGNGDVVKLLSAVHSRNSIYDQTGNVIEMTPEIVPFQGLKLYTYVFVGWIPRALWPDKPGMNDANRFYQRVYLHSSEADTQTSISVGYLAESYISFGVPGVVGVMFLVGYMLNCLQQVSLRSNSGSFLQIVGIILFLNVLSVQLQMAQLVSSLLQVCGLSAVLFYPVLRAFRTSRSAGHVDAPFLSPPIGEPAR